MNQEQNNVPVGDASNIPQVTKQFQNQEDHEIREFYLHQARLMYPTMATDTPDNVRLGILKQRTARLVEMLTLFEHSWTEEMPVIQKACLSYLAMEIVPRKERQQVVNAWANWSDFQFKLARYRGLLTRFLQYHHRMKLEIESLRRTDNAEVAPENIEVNQEGGI